MPWLSIIIALLTFLGAKKNNPGNTSKALLAAGLAGATTYGVTHNTDWGKANLGDLDGVVSAPIGTGTVTVGGTDYTVPDGYTVKTDSNGAVVTSNGTPVLIPTGSGGLVNATADVLKSWGGTGTAAVIGTAAVAGSSTLQKYIPLLIAGGLIFVLIK